jgi:hypothetical protein
VEHPTAPRAPDGAYGTGWAYDTPTPLQTGVSPGSHRLETWRPRAFRNSSRPFDASSRPIQLAFLRRLNPSTINMRMRT